MHALTQDPSRRALLIGLGSVIVNPAFSYNLNNAPNDGVSRDILANAIKRPFEPGPNGLAKLQRNFPQIIEQNFAWKGTEETTANLDSLSEMEMSDLAELYMLSVSDLGCAPRLLHVLAHRADAQRLARLSRHFGFGNVYEALVVVAPSKSDAFLRLADRNSYGPVRGMGRFDRVSSYGGASRIQTGTSPTNFWPFLDKTIPQIYNIYRTAVVGATSVLASLVQTSFTVGYGLAWSWYVGYEVVGPALNSLVQTYAPNAYTALGGTIDTMVIRIQTDLKTTFGPEPLATSQQTMINSFGANSSQSGFNRGGDYGATQAIRDAGSGGGGGGSGNCEPGRQCPIQPDGATPTPTTTT